MHAIPEVMKAVVVERFGGPENLLLREIPTPSPGPSQVLIAVHTAGVGTWDADLRRGWWPEGRAPLPQVLGTDGSGTVAGLGSRVRRFRVGQPVCAYQFSNPMGGFYAQYVVVAADQVARTPRGLDLRSAGAGLATGLTAQQQIYPINSNCHDSDRQFPSSGHKFAGTHIEFSLLGFAQHFIAEIK